MKFTTKSGREVTIADFRSRKVDREYNEAMLKDSFVDAEGNAKIQVNNMQKANDVLVRGMTGLSQDEVDIMNTEDFEEILAKINEEHAKTSPQTASSVVGEIVSKEESDSPEST